MRFPLALIFLAASMPALASNPECMGSDGESWKSVDLPVEMKAGECPPSLELPARLGALRYELAAPPTKFPHKTICSWIWVRGSGGALAPGLTSFICTLHH